MGDNGSDQRPRIDPKDLCDLGIAMFVGAGMVASEAEPLVDLLIETSMRGVDSHGITRFPIYSARIRAGGIVSPAPLEWVRDGGATSLLDAGSGAGHIAGLAATERAIERATQHGIAAVGVRMSNHLGALASYAQRIAEAGHYAIVTTNASPQMAPTGGIEGLLGNNPIAMAVPFRDQPIVMDMATSVAARGKIRVAAARGEPIPEGWARNALGEPTTDAAEAMEGLVEPIAGHKGYSLVFMTDILCGIMMESMNSRDVGELTPYENPTHAGHIFIAIDIERFTTRVRFEERVQKLVDDIHGVKRAKGAYEVFVPGEIEQRTAEDRSRLGIPASVEMLQEFRDAAALYGVESPAWLEEALADEGS